MKKTVLCITTIVLAVVTNLPAAGISGAFNFTGSLTVTQTTISWVSNASVPNEATMGATALSGNFAGLGGSTITIQNLDRTTEPVGILFPAQPFIAFPTTIPGYSLLIDFIALGSFPSTECHNATTFAGQTCTLSSADVPGGSPFMFTNTASDGTHVDGSSAQWSMRGETSDGNQWAGVWTSQFNTSYQDVLASFFGPAGAVTNSYSASINIVPEPDTTLLLGAGLMLVGLGVRRFGKV